MWSSQTKVKPVSPVLQGRFLTTGPPGKPWIINGKPNLHLLNKPHLVMIHYLFYMLLDSICQNFVKDLYVWVHKGYWSVVFWSGSICLVLLSGKCFPNRGSISFCLISWKNLFRIDHQFRHLVVSDSVTPMDGIDMSFKYSLEFTIKDI